MLHCAWAEDVGTSLGHPVPVSVSRTYRYGVALSEVLHRSCKKCACVCVSFNVNINPLLKIYRRMYVRESMSQ